MSVRQRKLVQATRILSKYFGIHSVKESAEMAALRDINTDPSLGSGGRNENIEVSAPTEAEATLINMLIDTADGAYTTHEFLTRFSSVFENLTSQELEVAKASFGRLLHLHYEKDNNFVVHQRGQYNVNDFLNAEYGNADDETPITDIGVRQMLGHGAPGADTNFSINQIPSRPTKEFPGLSIYVSNSPRVTIESQNTAASTIFLNGIPNVELMRAVPYVNVELFFPRPPVSAIGRQLQNLSLNKFLLGAESPGKHSVTEFMAEADTTAGSNISSRAGTEDSPIPEIYSVTGMEIFTSPQTLVNMENVPESARSNEVLDKFRPLLTLQDLEINIQPSRGFLSYKNGSLSFKLHDRSRLAEVSEFIRADLYGTNEITIEYGWSHPDGAVNNSDNPYGDLIDGLRVKEKYMVTNSSFTFEPSGEVNIKLEIAMRGVTEFDTELMSSEGAGFTQSLNDIEELQREIAELRQRVFPNSSTTTMQEVRGHQILNAAQDATNNIILTSELRTALANFRRQYSTSSNPSARELARKITDLFGNESSNSAARRQGNTTDSNGQITNFANLRRSIQESIRRKIEVLQTNIDPFLPNNIVDSGHRHIDDHSRGQEEQTARQAFRNHAFSVGSVANIGPTSLARLLLLFVGQPLANTKHYDEVQMFFYPFNEYAGKASRLNIANFVVDMQYFADELARYRLEHISRSSVMSLKQFMNFIGDILLDDPAASSYGLWDESGELFRTKYTDPEGRVRGPTVPKNDPAVYQQRMEAILRDYTPDGTFRPPQLGIYIETLPGKTGVNEADDDDSVSSQSILRLHIFDKASTAYEPIGRMLLAARRDQVRSIGGIATNQAAQSGNASVTRAREEIAASAIASAEGIGLIEKIPSANVSEDLASTGVATEGSSTIYRIKGGPKKLKEFIMLNSPYVIFGAGGTTIKSAQMNSMQNSSLATVNLLRSFRREEGTTPNGENVGGLPMNVIPTVMNMECVGNPLLNYMQSYFLDFQTGTTVDNMYAITGVGHKFTQGDFSTSVKFTPIDAWGSYRSLISTIGSSLTILAEAGQEEENDSNNQNDPGGS